LPLSLALSRSASSASEFAPLLGFSTARLFGRKEVLGILEFELQRQRLLTLNGYAGVGKPA
jgi:hypothetical protein